MRDKKQYPVIDIAKFIFCLCIVAIHTELTLCIPDPAGYMINKAICRVAVPFFFLASGFFFQKNLCRKVDYKNENPSLRASVISYSSRLFKPLVFFEAINVMLVLIQKMKSGGWNSQHLYICCKEL